MPLTYSFALLALFCILLVGEFFVPSAGMVGLAAAITGTTAIVIAFTHSLTAGFSMMGGVGICTVTILYAMVHYWPHTPIGRMILNRRPGQLAEPVEHRLRTGEKRKDLVGLIGIAKTDLLPSGLVIIDGKRLDAVSDGSPIDAGTQIVVVSAVAGKIRVKTAQRGDLAPEQTDIERKTESIESSLDSLDFDEFEN